MRDKTPSNDIFSEVCISFIRNISSHPNNSITQKIRTVLQKHLTFKLVHIRCTGAVKFDYQIKKEREKCRNKKNETKLIIA